MNKNLKIGLIVLSVVGVSVGAYFAIKLYKLKEAYKTNLTPEDVIKIIDEKAKDLGTEMEEDPDLKTISSQLSTSGESARNVEEDISEYE